ncbi:uncharacterized protein [Nicotiana sylvestris]|uniref:uncharacterized protein n=1 Tax=Nicotiana sylvestris TaxID=4096 RepID=UPI00388CC5CD
MKTKDTHKLLDILTQTRYDLLLLDTVLDPVQFCYPSSSSRLEPSYECSEYITKSFKNELDPNGVNWKSVSNEIKKFYFGEFKKVFYWDSSIDSAVRSNESVGQQKDTPLRKPIAALAVVFMAVALSYVQKLGLEGEMIYSVFIAFVRLSIIGFVLQFIFSQENAGWIILAYLFIMLNETWLKRYYNNKHTQSDIDQCKAYYQAVGGEKKRRVYGLGSQAKCYYGPNLHGSFGSDAASSATPPNAQSTPTGNLDELVMRLILALTDHIVPVIV